MPSVTDPSLSREDSRSSRWDFVLAVVMGAALLGFGWVDTRSFLQSRHKLPFTFSLNARPGGVRVGPRQEFFRDAAGDYVRLENFALLESLYTASIRHNLGPVCSMEIVSPHTRARLSFRFVNTYPDQDFAVACNGRMLEHITHLTPGTVSRLYALDLHPGSNVVTFTCLRYNHDGTNQDIEDPRPIAGTFDAMNLLLE